MPRQNDKNDRRLGQPPDYFSRRTQYRLLLGVFLCMAAIVWLMNVLDLDDIGLTDNSENTTTTERSYNDHEQQLRQFGRLDLDDLSAEEQVTIQLRRELWSNILEDLSGSQSLDLLILINDLAVGNPITPTLEVQWADIFKKMDEEYRQFHSNTLLGATTEPSPFNPSQRAALLKATVSLQAWWTDDVRTALVNPFESTGDTNRETAAEIQTLIDSIAVKRIEDNKSFRRSGELAWYRMYQQLKQMRQTLGSFDDLSFGATSFAQLYRQSEFQRGRLLSIKGNVRQAYKVSSVSNPLGIKEFYVLTIRVRNDDSPVIVYCLDAPESFPDVPNKDPNGDTLLLNQNDQIDLTGYFFKIWAYSTPEGTYTAPLLVADTFRWTADTGILPEELLSPAESAGMPAWLVLLIAGIVAVGICGYVYASSNRQSLAALAQRNLVPTRDTLDIAADQVIPSAAATLKELENDETIVGKVDLNELLSEKETDSTE